MQKIIKIDKKVIVLFEDGTYCEKDNVSEEFFKSIVNTQDEEKLFEIFNPKIGEARKKYHEFVSMLEGIDKSQLLTIKGESIYWEEISQLSLPMELVASIIKAELNQDEIKIESYKNFWTLMCLNPDEECRKNLFWFLNRNGLSISRQGFFVAYRNVLPYGKDDSGNEIFTDYHSRTTRIKIGDMVAIPRDKCDCDSNNECSRGLHLASKNWLNKNYYGTVGMVCLCNPADVVAVPYNSKYGKLRTCAYLPIEKLEYGEDDKPIPYPAEDGFDCSYITKVIYEGLMGTEEDSPYKIIIPEVPGVNRNKISDTLLNMAMKCITERQV